MVGDQKGKRALSFLLSHVQLSYLSAHSLRFCNIPSGLSKPCQNLRLISSLSVFTFDHIVSSLLCVDLKQLLVSVPFCDLFRDSNDSHTPSNRIQPFTLDFVSYSRVQVLKNTNL